MYFPVVKNMCSQWEYILKPAAAYFIIELSDDN